MSTTEGVVVEAHRPPKPGFVLPEGKRSKKCANGHEWTEATMNWTLLTRREGMKVWSRRCKICTNTQAKARRRAAKRGQ